MPRANFLLKSFSCNQQFISAFSRDFQALRNDRNSGFENPRREVAVCRRPVWKGRGDIGTMRAIYLPTTRRVSVSRAIAREHSMQSILKPLGLEAINDGTWYGAQSSADDTQPLIESINPANGEPIASVRTR